MIEIPKSLQHIEMKIEEPLCHYTYTKTGGPADYLMFPTSKEDVKDILSFCHKQTIPWMVLGNGSNLIIREGGIRGIVIITEKMRTVSVEDNSLVIECGAELKEVAMVAAKNGLAGFEFASGIPGSIGGAVFMNAGAYGGEMKDIINTVTYIDSSGKLLEKKKEDCLFEYRHSVFQTIEGIIVSARVTLRAEDETIVRAEIERLTEIRESKQPLEYPSCGSVFKRPEGHYTGALIQDAGLQGYQIGGAQVSRKHAGFIVNRGGATATDYIELIQYIQNQVKDQFGIQLETEVKIIGEPI